MKSYPVVPHVSRACTRARARLFYSAAACSLVVAACDASTGPLFDEVEAPSDVMMTPDDGDPPVMEMPNDDVEEMPPSDDGMPDDMAPENPSDELPLDGETPVDDGDDGEDDVEDPPDMEEPPVDPPLEPEPTVPAIIEVFPENGATGVDGETPIVITFSEPMDQAATEAAYQSEGIPSTGVTFSWNEDSTELTITPDAPLAYDSGPDPASVEARRYSFFISSSAVDLEGDGLGTTAEFSFSVLRQIEGTFMAVQDRALSGNWRSDGTYGGPNANSNCARNTTQNMCVGDATDNDRWQGFITFDLSALPVTMTRISDASLSLQITSGDGTPFGNGNQALGRLMVDHIAFDEIGVSAFTAQPLAVLGPIAQSGNVGSVLSMNVLSAVALDAEAGAFTQFRLRFERGTDNNEDADVVRSDWDTQSLSLKYLIP